MPRGTRMSRAEHATIRCEWKTKRPLQEYAHLSDNQLQGQIGAPYGFLYRAVARAIINKSKDNLDSDDDHCTICIDKRALAHPKVKREISPDASSSTTQVGKGRVTSPSPIAGPSTAASLKDVIFVQSDDDDDDSTPGHSPGRQVSSVPSLASPRKRKISRIVSDDDDDSEEWMPARASSGMAHSPIRKKQHTRRSTNTSGVAIFLKTVDPAYLRHAAILADLGITTREHLKKIQSMNPEVREKFLLRIEQKGVSALERAIIEDAIIKLPD